ncbi:MAG: type VI secretion system ATPase TssH [Methylomonas sp.]|nr:MAG: type VI secretion system ATPase TssH [Methylomonas sp.]
MTTSLKTLIGKLNETCRTAATRAATLCVERGHYEVDIEHLLLALMEQPKSDLSVVLQRHKINKDQLETDLREKLDQFQTGNTRTPVFSLYLPKLFEHGWLIASLEPEEHNLQPVRSAHLLLALLTEPDLSQLAYRGSKTLTGIKLEQLKHNLPKLTTGSQEQAPAFNGRHAIDEAAEPAPDANGQTLAAKTPALDQFTTNLTQRAREGLIDPVIGRDSEIRLAIDILMRRRQNNPILTGEAGVGKTAVVEGLALRIAAKDIPEVLQTVEIHTLDMGLLQAGASVKGEFENRLKNVISEVKKSPHPIILFIDEAHTMIGAGGQAGQSDAANLLKPALARGELRTLAATTWSEYKKYFEKDAALARRFQVIKVEEPSEALACAMLRAMVPLMEQHFKVRIYDQAVTEAVRLSHRYISGRQLPDKAISVLDTACAKVALGQSAMPALLENTARQLEHTFAEITALAREQNIGGGHGSRLEELNSLKQRLQDEHAALSQRWQQEQAMVEQIRRIRTQLEAAAELDPVTEAKPSRSRKSTAAKPEPPELSALNALLAELRTLQGEQPLMPVQVDGHSVAEVIAAWTGIPLGKMLKDDLNTVRTLERSLQEHVLGQDHALKAIAQRIRTARANLDDPNKPQGVFLFVGPSGTGKTETALALADSLFGGERKLVTLNMSEYQEAHSVSGLKGSPPGYVGYGEGGVLTEAVRRNPYSVILLDEIEKAHPDVQELFYQVFDKGVLDDAEGRTIDFKNTLIILTSNVGSSQTMQACLNQAPEDLPGPEDLAGLLRPYLVKAFKPAFLGRLQVVPFYPLTDDRLIQIIELKLKRIARRIQDHHHAQLHYDERFLEAVLARCTEVDSGARTIDHLLNGTLLPALADALLASLAGGETVNSVKVSADKHGQFRYVVK